MLTNKGDLQLNMVSEPRYGPELYGFFCNQNLHCTHNESVAKANHFQMSMRVLLMEFQKVYCHV